MVKSDLSFIRGSMRERHRVIIHTKTEEVCTSAVRSGPVSCVISADSGVAHEPDADVGR
jgi:hypothetical protein